MTPIQIQIHKDAVEAARNYVRAEWPLIQTLQAVEREKLYKDVGQPSLFSYALKELGLTELAAYAFSTVVKKSLRLPPLSKALQDRRFGVLKVARITSVLNDENLTELMDFMDHCTNRELDERRAKLNPKKTRKTSKKPIREGWVRFATDLSKESLAKLERAMTLRSKKKGVDENEIIGEVFDEWLERHDPVRKAQRAHKKTVPPKKPTTCAHKPEKRVPLTAAEIHAVNNRDKGQCVFVNAGGDRCQETKWVHLHHVIEASKGGTNHPSNIRTLCAFHHDLVHQLSFPIEAQFNWIHLPAPENH